MSEALCIDTMAAPQSVFAAIRTGGRHLVPYCEIKAETFMVDRAVCDYKPPEGAEPDSVKIGVAESTLQLLPYLPLITPTNRIYLYSRGKGGGEARLHANTSVALGGHVDGLVPHGKSLAQWLVDEAFRECWEEAKVNPARVVFTHFLVDRTNPVGRVHLGILAPIEISDEEADTIGSAEAGVIENDGFVDLAALHNTSEMFNKLENWSQMVVNHLYETRVG